MVVDDDSGLLLSIKGTLVGAGIPEPALISDSRRVMEAVASHSFQLILLDLMMPHQGGMELLKQIKGEYPAIECVVITAMDDVSSAVQAMRLGAYDYVVKPVDPEKLIILVRRALERYNLRKELAIYERRSSFSDLGCPEAFKDMVAEDEVMARVFHQVESVAPTDYSLIITGESGTGKEMLARIVHRLSNRATCPFVAVNMAAFTRGLFEDDLFGHVKGAYTGAMAEKRGFFETAHGGTLFLDEITELDDELQGKLLRVLQEGELYRVGSTRASNVDVRIIAASNRDPQEEMNRARLRKDLFYRLSMFHIHVPPLRQRKKDILPLARHFLKIHAERNQKVIHSLEPDLAERLLQYAFPGNVRELENIISSAVLLETGETVRLAAVEDLVSLPFVPAASVEEGLTLAQMEKNHIYRVLASVGGNRTQASKILGVGLRTLQRKLREYGDPSSSMPNRRGTPFLHKSRNLLKT